MRREVKYFNIGVISLEDVSFLQDTQKIIFFVIFAQDLPL